eukprot:scaffold4410_cov78-Cylindrotheca_fusiformis.AAC.4
MKKNANNNNNTAQTRPDAAAAIGAAAALGGVRISDSSSDKSGSGIHRRDINFASQGLDDLNNLPELGMVDGGVVAILEKEVELHLGLNIRA